MSAHHGCPVLALRIGWRTLASEKNITAHWYIFFYVCLSNLPLFLLHFINPSSCAGCESLSVCRTTHQSSEFILEVWLMEATQVHFGRLLVGGRRAVGVPDVSGWSIHLKQQLFLKRGREFMFTPSSLDVEEN